MCLTLQHLATLCYFYKDSVASGVEDEPSVVSGCLDSAAFNTFCWIWLLPLITSDGGQERQYNFSAKTGARL